MDGYQGDAVGWMRQEARRGSSWVRRLALTPIREGLRAATGATGRLLRGFRGMGKRKGRSFSMLGLDLAGDWGPFTTWFTRRHRQSYMVKSPPKEPASVEQAAVRARFAAATAGWRALTQAQRDDYEQATLQLHIRMTGYNLWQHCAILGAWRDASEAARLTGLPLYIP